jgi:poly(beta-D-mannuronate) lyase
MTSELLVTQPHLDTSGILRKSGPFTDIDDFLDAIKDAQAGEEIILANGSYNVSRNKDTKFSGRRGTAANPIIVRAETVGGATLQGSAGYTLDNCKFFTWYGFNHEHEATSKEENIVFVGGNNNRFARCDIKLADKIEIDGEVKRADEIDGIDKEFLDDENVRHWLKISNCKTMKVDHCHFHNKETKGNFCIVGFDQDNKNGEGPLFEYNHFQHQDLDLHVDAEDIGDAGGEGVRMGHSDMDRTYFRAIFRYNYLHKCNGDGETVTNKSSGNIYYNNSWVDNNGSLVLRHGDSTAVLGNCFEKCGLRVGGADNLIANNHFTRNSNDNGGRRPLVIMNGDMVRPTEPGGNMECVINNDIILNTFANGDGTTEQIVHWGWSSKSEKPTGNRFRGNIITAKNGRLLEFVNGATSSGNTISDNIGFVTGDADFGDLSTGMATRIDPLLILEDGNSNDGINRLQDGSPARNKFPGTPFSSLTTVDIFGMTRGENTDAGCCQFSTGSTTIPKKRITPADVGAKATTDLGNSPPWNPNSED